MVPSEDTTSHIHIECDVSSNIIPGEGDTRSTRQLIEFNFQIVQSNTSSYISGAGGGLSRQSKYF